MRESRAGDWGGGGEENEDDHTMWTRSVKSVSLRVRGVDPTRPFLYPFTVDGGTRNCSLCPFSSGHNRGMLRGERSEGTYAHIKGTRIRGIHIPPQIARDHSPSLLLFIQPQTPAAGQKKKKKKRRKKDDTYNATIKQPHGSLSRSEVSSNRTVQCTGALDRRPFAHFDIKTLPGGGL